MAPNIVKQPVDSFDFMWVCEFAVVCMCKCTRFTVRQILFVNGASTYVHKCVCVCTWNLIARRDPARIAAAADQWQERYTVNEVYLWLWEKNAVKPTQMAAAADQSPKCYWIHMGIRTLGLGSCGSIRVYITHTQPHTHMLTYMHLPIYRHI